MRKIFFFAASLLLAIGHEGFADEFLDVETLPTLRTQQYEAPYKHIVVFSAPRTGSSLVYNVFKFLFEHDSQLLSNHTVFDLNNRVLKTHIFEDLNRFNPSSRVLYIYPIRNPLTASISILRISMGAITDFQAFAREMIKSQAHYLILSERLETKGKAVWRLRFEDFNNNLDYLFKYIETKLQITIEPQDKELMRKGYSKESVALNVEHFDTFNKYLPIAGFHGQHIDVNGFKAPREFVHWLGVYVQAAKPLFRKYGYFTRKKAVTSSSSSSSTDQKVKV